VVHPQAGDVSGEPTFTPYTVSPELRNRQEFVQLLRQSYPAELRDAGIGGTAIAPRADRHGGHRPGDTGDGEYGASALDEAAQQVMGEARFTPARNRDEGGAGVGAAAGDASARARRRGPTRRPSAAPHRLARHRSRAPGERPAAEAPTFTPFTQAPELRNREEFQQALRDRYPDDMRDAGIGGTILLHVFIDTEGRVAETRVAEGSGHAQLDEAAEEVMREARFAPARNRDEIVPVWIQLPVSFRAPAPGS
jgi:TonB family protein